MSTERLSLENLSDVSEASIQESYVRAYKRITHFYVMAVTEMYDTESLGNICLPRCMIFGSYAHAMKTFHRALELELEASTLRTGTVRRFMLIGRDNYMAEEEAEAIL